MENLFDGFEAANDAKPITSLLNEYPVAAAATMLEAIARWKRNKVMREIESLTHKPSKHAKGKIGGKVKDGR